jgi:hypothetical protein
MQNSKQFDSKRMYENILKGLLFFKKTDIKDISVFFKVEFEDKEIAKRLGLNGIHRKDCGIYFRKN